MSMFVIRHMTCTMFKYLNPWIDFPKCIPTAKGWKKKKSPWERYFPLGPPAHVPELGHVFQSHRIQMLRKEEVQYT